MIVCHVRRKLARPHPKTTQDRVDDHKIGLSGETPPEIEITSKPEIRIDAAGFLPQSRPPECGFLLDERAREPAVENTGADGLSRESNDRREIQHRAGFSNNRRAPCHPLDIREASKNLLDRRQGARFETVVGVDPRHGIRIAAGCKAAIDRIVKASIRFASERKFDAFAENRKVAREAAFPCRQDLQCPVFRPAVLDVIADRERACLAYHAQNRLIEEFLAVENGRHNAEAHLICPLAKNEIASVRHRKRLATALLIKKPQSAPTFSTVASLSQ